MKNSGALPHSKKEVSRVALVLGLLICCASWWFYSHGFLLYYGDAQAHLNISRSIIDSRTPGYDQLGTVWLPVLHLLCLPFVGNDWLWSTGLAGTLPVALCFVVAGTFFYLAARDTYGETSAALVAVACLALNPNLLYLSVIPMTETVFLAGISVLLFAACRYRLTQNRKLIVLGVVASWWMSLTRYDGWFLIPFAAGWFALWSGSKKWNVFFAFVALASLAPLYWFAHNWWETSNLLDFFNGPYSPIAIQGHKPYPGYRHLGEAFHYYGAAGWLCAGGPLFLLGVVGLLCAWKSKTLAPLLFLTLTPAFYVWSMYSSGGSPIHLPTLWPYSYYNARYGMALLTWSAFAAGAAVTFFPLRRRKLLAALLPVLALSPWLLPPSRENWICWKESEHNSVARRAWTEGEAVYLQSHYHLGQGITARFSDVIGVFGKARIPLREILHEGNGPAWFAAQYRPDLFHPSRWVVMQENNDILTTTLPAGRKPPYTSIYEIQVKDAPPLKTYQRTGQE